MPKSKRELQNAVGLKSDKEWLDWLKSDLVKPHWVELWDNLVKNLAGQAKRGEGLHIVQRRLITGEAGGGRKYSAYFNDKDSWDSIDHYACFLYWVRHENEEDRRGVFFNKPSLSEKTKDAIVWGLKDWIRQAHAPSQIGRPHGGTAIFGTTRGKKRSLDKPSPANL